MRNDRTVKIPISYDLAFGMTVLMFNLWRLREDEGVERNRAIPHPMPIPTETAVRKGRMRWRLDRKRDEMGAEAMEGKVFEVGRWQLEGGWQSFFPSSEEGIQSRDLETAFFHWERSFERSSSLIAT